MQSSLSDWAYVSKGKEKFRPLGVPAVRCRVAQEVVRSLINPIFDAEFHDNSHGFREKDCGWKHPAPYPEISSGWRGV